MAAKKHSDIASSNIDPMALRNALGSFATGITVVTALGKDGQRVGMTANSFNSVSLSPALVLWSIDKASNCFDDFIQAEHYAIHILSANQQSISDQFAKSGGDKFAGLECTENHAGVPLLPKCSAYFECSIAHQYDGGDHIILVGSVANFVDSGTEPLIFYRGDYKKL